MAGLMMSLAVPLTAMLLSSQSSISTVTNEITSHAADSSITVWASAQLASPPSSRKAPGGRTKPVTSFQPVCREPDDSNQVGSCDMTAGICQDTGGGPQIAVWVMTRPFLPGSDPGSWRYTGAIICVSPAQARPGVVVTAQQFRRLPIPAPGISAQPDPAVRNTLINVPTNLFTSAEPRTLTTRVLGQPVQVRATPVRFSWHYGDGQSVSTRLPGRAYPVMPTAHVFTRPGTFTVRLTTTFRGEYSVAGGPWQPVLGTAQLGSAPLTITAEESRAVLVG